MFMSGAGGKTDHRLPNMPFKQCQHFPFAPREALGFNHHELNMGVQCKACGGIVDAGGALDGRRVFAEMAGYIVPALDMANEEESGGVEGSSLRITHGRNVHKAAQVRKAILGRVDSTA